MFEVVIKRMVACFAAAVISFTSFATVERTASVYHSYEFTTVADTPAPSEFTPFLMLILMSPDDFAVHGIITQ